MHARLSGNPDGAQNGADGAASELVLDTNVVLDLWLFGRPSLAPLSAALRAGTVRWLASPSMLMELALVRQRPFPARYPVSPQLLEPPALLLAEPAQPAPWRCRDRADQVFLDMAWQQRVPLWTRDRHLLCLRNKARRLGLLIETPEEGQLRLWPTATHED